MFTQLVEDIREAAMRGKLDWTTKGYVRKKVAGHRPGRKQDVPSEPADTPRQTKRTAAGPARPKTRRGSRPEGGPVFTKPSMKRLRRDVKKGVGRFRRQNPLSKRSTAGYAT